MLSRLQSKRSALPSEVRSRVKLFQEGMLEFSSNSPYSMIFIPMNSLQYLETKERIQLCFAQVADLLAPNGYFLFMVQRISPPDFADHKKSVVDWPDKPMVDEKRGISVGSRFVSYLEPGGRRMVKERTYHIVQPGQPIEAIECTTYSPIMSVSEYPSPLASAGLTTTVFGGYDERPEDGNGKTICFLCWKDRKDA